MLLQSLVVVLAGGLALASPVSYGSTAVQTKREVPATHRLHERHQPMWQNVWTKKSKISHSQILPMRIGLKQSNLEAGHDKLMDM